jgi:anti-anti-sigma factor
MSLLIDTAAQGDIRKLSLQGRLDTNTAPSLDEAVTGVLTPEVRTLVFDMADLEYISSAGVRTVFRAEKMMKEAEGKVYLVDLQAPVRKVFEIVKAMPAESIFTSWSELDDYLDKMQKRVRDGE